MLLVCLVTEVIEALQILGVETKPGAAAQKPVNLLLVLRSGKSPPCT